MKKSEALLLVQKQKDLKKMQEDLGIEKLKAFEDQILDKCMNIMAPALDFTEVDPENPEVIPKSISHMTAEQQQRWMRTARAAWMSNKDAPIGIKLAFTTMQTILNARAKTNVENKILNIESASFVNPSPKYDVLDVDNE